MRSNRLYGQIDEAINKFKGDVYNSLDNVSKYEEIIEDLTHMIVYKQFKGGQSISFDKFKSLDFGESLEYPSTNDRVITAVKTSQTDTEIEFEAEFEGGAILYRHRHDDADEVMKITSDSVFKFMLGKESDGTHQNRTLVKGDVIIIKATVDHQIINMSNDSGTIHTKLIKVC